MEQALAEIRIVLVEPAGALNVGAIARAMKNMGLTQLLLVNPHCDPLGADARQMAVHAADVLESARTVMTLEEALAGCRRVIATTGRDRTTLDIDLEKPEDALSWIVPPAGSDPEPAALLFGPEDRGLSNLELNYAQRFVRIPSHAAYPSLNLAQAVAICCYQLYTTVLHHHANEGSGASPAAPMLVTSSSAPLATRDALEGYYRDLEALLLKIGYLYPHTAPSRMEKFRRLLNRAYPSEGEVAMLRGIISQMEWALNGSNVQQ